MSRVLLHAPGDQPRGQAARTARLPQGGALRARAPRAGVAPCGTCGGTGRTSTGDTCPDCSGNQPPQGG